MAFASFFPTCAINYFFFFLHAWMLYAAAYPDLRLPRNAVRLCLDQTTGQAGRQAGPLPWLQPTIFFSLSDIVDFMIRGAAAIQASASAANGPSGGRRQGCRVGLGEKKRKKSRKSAASLCT